MKMRIPFPPRPILTAVFLLIAFAAPEFAFAATQSRVASAETVKAIQSDGSAHVIVELRTQQAYRPEHGLASGAVLKQRAEIALSQDRLKNLLKGTDYTIRRKFKTIPFVALTVDAAALAILDSAVLDVESVYEDGLAKPFLAESILQIEGDLALEAGLDGTGSVVAVADTGIDKDHSFLAGKVIDEACYALSADGTGGDCPNGQPTQTGSGAGVPCIFAPSSCRHGTHVAGIATGAGTSFSGVAPGASLISIQVFHSSLNCGFFEEVPCARAFASDIAAALERVYELRDQYPIASVNLSLGGGSSASACDADHPELLAIINNLKAAGIATVVASGNSALTNAISWPACISTAVSVGAVDESDIVASFSNVSEDLDLFAPGTAIESSIPGGGFATFSGTSMATPHIAGAWAVLEQANPAATVDDILSLFTSTGRPVTDNRAIDNVTKPRIRLGAALGLEYPLPVLSSVTPTSVTAWRDDTSLTITGSGLSRGTVVLIDGAAVPTIYVSDAELTAIITESVLATFATSFDVSLFTPPPGGGNSDSIQIAVVQPTLTVNTTAVLPGDPVTVSLANGPGGDFDWLALADVNDPDAVYLQWTYVGQGSTSADWTVSAPSALGDYEFRLFKDSGFTRIATSPTVTVEALAPAISSISPAQVVAGPDDVTLTVTGSNFYPQSEILIDGVPKATSFVSSDKLQATITSTDIATAASVDISVLTPPPGGGVSNTLSLSVAHPALTVSSTGVGPGELVTVTLTDGPGGPFDWLALAAVGDPDTTYLQWTYVDSGATTATWTVSMPATAGDYEFRLLESGGFKRLATSQAVTVGSGSTEPPPDPDPEPDPDPTTPPSLAVSATSVDGGDAVTVTMSDGQGGAYDWLALAAVGDPDTTYLQWTYVGSGATTATWTVNMPATPGDYEFRLFENGGYTRIATSPAVTVGSGSTEPPPDPEPDPDPTTPPALAVNLTSVGAGDAVTVTMTNGQGGTYDWLALAAVGDADTSYLQWTYVGDGVSEFVWTVNMPATAGDYEFRLFENGGFTRIATSPVVTVGSGSTEPPPDPGPDPTTPPSLAVNLTSVGAGDAVTVTMTDGPGGTSDWLALATVGASDTTYLQWTYVSSGATTATWTVNMPATPGDYEFRLFENGGYTRIATSPTVVVNP